VDQPDGRSDKGEEEGGKLVLLMSVVFVQIVKVVSHPTK
jgi:hypothetical protein